MSFYPLRFLIGIAEAGFFSIISTPPPGSEPSAVSDDFTVHRRSADLQHARLADFRFDHANTFDGVAGYVSWQWLFVIEGLPAGICGGVLPAARPHCRCPLAQQRGKRGMQAALDREAKAKPTIQCAMAC